MGLPGSAVMFIGEAPGRFGAARSGIPFMGDESGRRFERLLAEAGLTREQVFVTNAVRCLPLDDRGRNRRPLFSEVAACGTWLDSELRAARPRVVATLGTTALDALQRIERHSLRLRDAAGTAVPWRGSVVVPLYHPGVRSTVHRPWDMQVRDWRELGRLLREELALIRG